jgi:hypothetical protein
VITTPALFALKVQRKVSNGVAGLAAGGSSLDRKKSRQFVRMPLDGQLRRITLAEDPGSTWPERHFPSAPIGTAGCVQLLAWLGFFNSRPSGGGEHRR